MEKSGHFVNHLFETCEKCMNWCKCAHIHVNYWNWIIKYFQRTMESSRKRERERHAFDIVMQMFMNEKKYAKNVCDVRGGQCTIPKCPHSKWMVKSIVDMQKPTKNTQSGGMKYVDETNSCSCTRAIQLSKWNVWNVLFWSLCVPCTMHTAVWYVAAAAAAITKNVIL